jgi:putative intracellular protease/amidase
LGDACTYFVRRRSDHQYSQREVAPLAAVAQLDKTVRVDSVRQEDFDTVFYPGGDGPMWDPA